MPPLENMPSLKAARKWKCSRAGSSASHLKSVYDFEETDSSVIDLLERSIYQYVNNGTATFPKAVFLLQHFYSQSRVVLSVENIQLNMTFKQGRLLVLYMKM